MKSHPTLTSIALLACAATLFDGAVASGQEYDLSWYTIDAGGGNSSGENFELSGTVGQHDAGAIMTGGNFELAGGFWALSQQKSILLGDVNHDGVVDLLDIAPFVDAITNGTYIAEADINQDGVVDLLDIAPFVELLTGG